MFFRMKSFLCLFFVSQILIISSYQPDPSFSGVYKPRLDLNGEDYTASFLISKKRFLDSEKMLRKVDASSGGEGVSTSITRRENDNCVKCNQVMSRDYLDFMIEHMSSTSNQLSEKSEESKSFIQNLRKSTVKMRTQLPERMKDIRLEQTIGIIIYSSRSVAVDTNQFQTRSRKLFMQSTFWSVYRYIPNIAIFVDSEEEFQIVGNMTLPFWNVFRIPPVKDYKFHLLKHSLIYAAEQMKVTTPKNSWSDFKYLYFTEGDQVLHMRGASDIYNAVDYNDGFTLLLPHRMQTLPMTKSLPWHTPDALNDSAVSAVHMTTTLINENITESAGSCCDNGRYKFGDCGNWWYNCRQHGKINLHYWLQFDKTGLTMPLITEHQGNCVYSPTKQLCSVPGECKYRTLPDFGPNKDAPAGKDYFCGEMPLVQFIGGKSKWTG